MNRTERYVDHRESATGALVVVFEHRGRMAKAGYAWGVLCAEHEHRAWVPVASQAYQLAASPELFCRECEEGAAVAGVAALASDLHHAVDGFDQPVLLEAGQSGRLASLSRWARWRLRPLLSASRASDA